MITLLPNSLQINGLTRKVFVFPVQSVILLGEFGHTDAESLHLRGKVSVLAGKIRDLSVELVVTALKFAVSVFKSFVTLRQISYVSISLCEKNSKGKRYKYRVKVLETETMIRMYWFESLSFSIIHV